jgi:YHS domain-containing protein
MTRSLFIFLGTFVVGALVALVTRAAWYAPEPAHEGHASDGDYAPMVSNVTPAVAAPVASTTGPAAAPAAAHADHGAMKTAPAPASGVPVNTVCAICGMDVDPSLPTIEYEGKTIGFGCKMCPPKFKAEPDRYGPIYLRNEVIKR